MKSVRAILSVAVLSLGLTAVALPAAAAPPALPDGNQLFSASCVGDGLELFSVDALTAVGTSVGPATATGGLGCGYQAAWDVSAQTLYGFDWRNDQPLVRFDLTTGAATVIGSIVDGDGDYIWAYALAIDLEGHAYVNTRDSLYSLDLTTGVATLLGPLEGMDASAFGFSVDPTSGLLYLLEETGDLLLIDPEAVTATEVATWQFSADGQNTWGLAIDSAGTAWVVEFPGDEVYSALWSTPLATFGGDPQRSGDLVDADGVSWGSWWIANVFARVAPAPAPAPALALADTGLDIASLALGGVLLAASGAFLLARRPTGRVRQP